jgi:hypothetical protein
VKWFPLDRFAPPSKTWIISQTGLTLTEGASIFAPIPDFPPAKYGYNFFSGNENEEKGLSSTSLYWLRLTEGIPALSSASGR